MLTLYRRHNPTYCPHKARTHRRCSCPIWVQGTLRGKPIREALKERVWSEAERTIAKWEAREKTVPAGEEKARSIAPSVAAEKYLNHCQVENNIAHATFLSYRKTLSHFLGFLDESKVIDIGLITTQIIRDFLSTRAQYTPRTRRKELEHLRFFLWFCVDNDWIRKNPAAVKGGRGIRVKVPRGGATMPLSDEEIKALLAAADGMSNQAASSRDRQRAKALILTLAYTGLRISDVMSLKRTDVREDGSIQLEIVKTKQPLVVYLGEQVVSALNAIPKESFYFFWSGPGNSKLTTATGTARRTLSRLGKKAAISVHPHRFRDTFAQKVLEATGDIRALQVALGHTSVRTTEMAYVHLGEQHKKRVQETFAKVKYIR